MATNSKKTEALADGEQLQPIEQLRDQCHTDAAVFAGTAAMYGWRKGREITQTEYERAVDQFRRSAAGRRT